MDVFIGIDPSLNSTGLCILKYEGEEKISEYFAIVKPDKLNKKEQIAQDKYLFFDYWLYDKVDIKVYDNDNHKHEYFKTCNFILALDKILEVIKENVDFDNDSVYLLQEGISYGSTLRTKSVFDLAGLNYMIRDRVLHLLKNRFVESHYTIATPQNIKKYASGAGNCKKEVLVDLFKILYPNFDLPKIDDVCDAYFMASYARFLKIERDNNE